MPTRCFNRLVGVILLAAVAASPALAGRAKPKSGFGATAPVVPVAPAIANGAIFQAANGYVALYEGTRARAVGDPVTIVLVENITSTKDGTLYVGSLGSGGLLRIKAGSSKAEIWIKPGAFGSRSIFGVLADELRVAPELEEPRRKLERADGALLIAAEQIDFELVPQARGRVARL